ncbi:PPK2 family polyphosphate kinase [Solimonas terrae]|uniref:Polyphosphate kinase 2 family protein n=1 Tax=Solimonas terrae TaxID=1396819 RepID=A0A6M2BWF0_9GAMM|nr:PPK2 family polyphosphate kinase [Solimonas terrae]NGY06595.1 polyphosphate kinase 2 family protein [Solimonas terrae]
MARKQYVADSPFLVPFDGSFKVARARSAPDKGRTDKSDNERQLAAAVAELDVLQRTLYADARHAVLLVFQATDAAGKDSTIRAVLTGINPAGCQVVSFKRPSEEELRHDFLWRCARALPERGRIGVFNRSYYEEVLTVRVHPQLLAAQQLPWRPDGDKKLWRERLQSIADFERHLARNGTVILKFWLNVSREEQRQRLLARLDEPEKNWKFESGDLVERAHWADYRKAYQHLLNQTSTPWAPWYAIPADDKPYMRAQVAQIVVERLRELDLQYPQLEKAEAAKLADLRRQLLVD